MTGVALIAIMLDRSPFSLRLVAFSAILVLLVSPESVWSVSFQMSFAAVTCLVAVAEAMRPVLTKFYADAGWIKKAGLFIGGSIMTSLVASIATAPYSLYHFEQIASYSVLANTISVPLSGLIIMPMLMVSYVLMPFGAAAWSLKLMGLGVEWLLNVAWWTQNLSGSVITTAAMPELAMVMVTIAGLILILFQGKGKLLCLIPFCVAMISVLMFQPPDILVSDEGNVMAIKDGDTVYISSARRDKFTVETWIKRWNARDDVPTPFPRQGEIALASGGYIACDPAACRIETRGMRLVFGARPYELHEDCAWADIIVSDARLPRDFCGGKPVQVFGYYNFKQSGAIAIYAGGNIRTVGDDRGDRPWTSSYRNNQ
jgi:competence protein ComEC